MLIAHYTSIETAFAKIIPTQKIKFGALTNTNDPYEVRMDWHLGTRVSADPLEDANSIIEGNEKSRQELKETLRIGCFSYCQNNSLECGNNSHLWTYYASAKDGIDQGCALIFDSEILTSNIHLNNNQKLIRSDKIRYANAFQLFVENGITVSADAFMLKTERWSEEKEYRIIIKNLSGNHRHDFVDISSSLKVIVINASQFSQLNQRFINGMNSLCQSEVLWRRRIYDAFSHEFYLSE